MHTLENLRVAVAAESCCAEPLPHTEILAMIRDWVSEPICPSHVAIIAELLSRNMRESARSSRDIATDAEAVVRLALKARWWLTSERLDAANERFAAAIAILANYHVLPVRDDTLVRDGSATFCNLAVIAEDQDPEWNGEFLIG